MREEDLYGEHNRYDRVAPIEADDAWLRQVVNECEIPPLLAALSLATGDLGLLRDSLKPPLPPMAARIEPQGGMSAAALEEAREAAFEALKSLRDHGATGLTSLDEQGLLRIMQFLTKEAGEEYFPLLTHELGLPREVGAPGWKFADIGPSNGFEVAVIGGGISGLAAARRLSQAGVPFTVFEKNTDVGGVWHDNVYPGCRLDTPNFAYSFSFAQRADWPDQFSKQGDIRSYLEGVATNFSLREHCEFGTEVLSMTYLEDQAKWLLEVRGADGSVSPRVFNAVFTAVGQLSLPSYPDIEGRESFEGASFHSAQWDPTYDYAGKHVAVVGTGASAYQIVPAVLDDVASLTVFQRNAPWMLPTPTYYSATPDGMMWLLRHVPFYGRWVRFWQFWIAAEGRLPFVTADPEWEGENSTSAANAELRRQLLESIEQQVGDLPELHKKMIPNYPPGSKRMTRDNGAWVKALRSPHVELVTDGIASMNATGVTTVDGTHREFDMIAYATGFKASDYLEPMKVTGIGGVDLHERWSGDAKAYLGAFVPGFPNLFMIMGPNTGVVVNGSSLYMSECLAEYALECLQQMFLAGKDAMTATEAALEEFVEYVDRGNERRTWGVTKVTTWYQNALGRASQVWPHSLREFYDVTRTVDLDAVTFYQQSSVESVLS